MAIDNTGPEPDIKERARELRRQGLSVKQIVAELGLTSTHIVQDWVQGVPPPAWTRRPRAKDAERARARELRTQGLTYDEIANELKVSKSSISLWTRDLPHPERGPDVPGPRLAGLRRHYELRRRKDEEERRRYVESVTDDVGKLSERELVIAGAVAYWAEGTKSKPWRRAETVIFTNSDADMIRLFLAFRLRVAIHESADEEQAKIFWAQVAGVPAASLQRSTLKRHRVPPTERTSARTTTAAWSSASFGARPCIGRSRASGSRSVTRPAIAWVASPGSSNWQDCGFWVHLSGFESLTGSSARRSGLPALATTR
jgi:transcriptional regulator with XRE-family HTH domain